MKAFFVLPPYAPSIAPGAYPNSVNNLCAVRISFAITGFARKPIDRNISIENFKPN